MLLTLLNDIEIRYTFMLLAWISSFCMLAISEATLNRYKERVCEYRKNYKLHKRIRKCIVIFSLMPATFLGVGFLFRWLKESCTGTTVAFVDRYPRYFSSTVIAIVLLVFAFSLMIIYIIDAIVSTYNLGGNSEGDSSSHSNNKSGSFDDYFRLWQEITKDIAKKLENRLETDGRTDIK